MLNILVQVMWIWLPGGMAADEVVLLIMSPQQTSLTGKPGMSDLPKQSLRGFKRIHLQAGESTAVQMLLLIEHFSHALPDTLGAPLCQSCLLHHSPPICL